MVLAVAPLVLLWPGASRGRSAALDAAILASFACVAATFLWGFLRGGSAYNAYFQLWRFLVALLFGLMLHAAIRTPRDLKAVGVTVFVAALVRAGLAVYFYWAVVDGRIDPPPPYMTTHDDTLLFVAGLVIAMSWALARRTGGAVTTAVVAAGLLLYAIVLNNRRLAWIELVLVVAVAYVLMFRQGWRVHRWVVLAAPVLAVYLAVGGSQEGAFFAPARALSTAGSHADASSLARQEEARNLLYTLWQAGNPLFGTGWGVPYQKVTSVYSNFGPEWWQYLYMPHNSLLGVAVYGGLVGIFGIWSVVPVAAYLGTRGYHGAARPVERAAAMASVCILPAYGAQCYGDIGFQALTCGLILGVALGAAGKTAAWAAAPRAFVPAAAIRSARPPAPRYRSRPAAIAASGSRRRD
jgi:hypothetical protein